MRLDHHVDRAFRGAPALDPLTARLAVGERQEREPDDLGLRARTADPAVQLAVLGHERPVADARRRRPLHPDHGGESERRSLLHEATGFDEDLHSRERLPWRKRSRRGPPDARAPAGRTTAFRAQSNAYCSYSSTLSFVTTAAGTTTCRGTSGGTSSEKPSSRPMRRAMFTALAAMFGL